MNKTVATFTLLTAFGLTGCDLFEFDLGIDIDEIIEGLVQPSAYWKLELSDSEETEQLPSYAIRYLTYKDGGMLLAQGISKDGGTELIVKVSQDETWPPAGTKSIGTAVAVSALAEQTTAGDVAVALTRADGEWVATSGTVTSNYGSTDHRFSLELNVTLMNLKTSEQLTMKASLRDNLSILCLPNSEQPTTEEGMDFSSPSALIEELDPDFAAPVCQEVLSCKNYFSSFQSTASCEGAIPAE